MEKDYLKKYGDKEVLSQRENDIKALQQGGQAPVQAAPAEGQVDPEQLLGVFIQAMQANDEAAATQAAMQFTAFFAEQMMAQQGGGGAQGGQPAPAMRGGGKTPIVFKKK